jgi:mycothiol system anti-sigma-R factor
MVEPHSEHEPTDVDCQAALTELYTFLDGELTDDRRSLIAHHLDDCNPCLEIYDFEAEIRMVIQRRCQDEVPDSLRVRVEAQLRGFVRGQADPGALGGATGSLPGDPL